MPALIAQRGAAGDAASGCEDPLGYDDHNFFVTCISTDQCCHTRWPILDAGRFRSHADARDYMPMHWLHVGRTARSKSQWLALHSILVLPLNYFAVCA